jgi:uncharacterized damage-inducible protein DinB
MPFAHQLNYLVRQLEEVLQQLSVNEYAAPMPVLHGSSIGQHVRHTLELFEELGKGYDTGVVDYDGRQRNKELEQNKELALRLLTSLPKATQKENLSLELVAGYPESGATSVPTNYFRELMYNIEHTVHHMALIKTALTQLPHIALPQGFGIASSTQRYQEACAQ